MSESKLEKLGTMMADILCNPDEESNNVRLRKISDEINTAARLATGIRADQLLDENIEEKPIVRLFWQVMANMTAQVFMEAAKVQTYYKELS